MKNVGAWRWLKVVGVVGGLGLAASALPGCGGDEAEVPRADGGSGGTGGAGGGPAGQGGAGGAAGGASLDPEYCEFENPPTHAPRPAATVGAVKAGLGEARLDMPMGSPLGGYGGRVRILGGTSPDGRKDRVNYGMVPSYGTHDTPVVRAVAMEVGGEKLVLVRLDSIYVIDNAVFALENALAPDGSLRGHVLIAGTHSHASYAGWQGSYVLMPGGNDRPREDMQQRVVASMKQAAQQALDSLAPARIGVNVTQDFDPQDTVTVDRRGENNDLLGPDGNTAGKRKDGQAWSLRLDRADGTPLVALVDFPIHGTVTEEDNLFASTDAPGAIERAASSLLGYPVIHLQGVGGDVTPVYEDGRKKCADQYRCLDMPSLELIGARAAQLVKPLIEGVQTGDSAALEVVTRSHRTGRTTTVTRPDGRLLSYAPVLPEGQEPDYKLLDPDGKVAVPVDEFNTLEGAGLCGDSSKGPPVPKSNLPGTVSKLGPYSSCLDIGSPGKTLLFGVFGVEAKDYATPSCDTVRVTASAIRLAGTPSGDYLFATIPGEPTAPLTAYLRNRSPAGPERTLVIGYAQDHIGYVLTAEDWLAGGYEPSINIWGPLEGEQVVEGIVEATRLAWTPEVEDPEVGSSRFTKFVYPPPAVDLTPTVTSDHGTARVDTPEGILWPDTKTALPTAQGAEVPRAVGAARFVFQGGDPTVDAPEVTIEHETSPGTFAPWKGEDGATPGTRHGEVVLSYAPMPLKATTLTGHAYAATWQPVPPGFALGAAARPFSMPTGVYRFRAQGRAQAASGVVSYEVVSPSFQVVAAPLGPSSKVALAGAELSVTARLGDAPGLRALVEQGASDEDVALPGPWTLTLTTKQGMTSTQTVDAPTNGEAKVTLEAAVAADLASVEVRDAQGNGGVLSP